MCITQRVVVFIFNIICSHLMILLGLFLLEPLHVSKMLALLTKDGSVWQLHLVWAKRHRGSDIQDCVMKFAFKSCSSKQHRNLVRNQYGMHHKGVIWGRVHFSSTACTGELSEPGTEGVELHSYQPICDGLISSCLHLRRLAGYYQPRIGTISYQ
jgi:hypothetical protein